MSDPSTSTTQYAFRSLKQLGLMSGPPSYNPISNFTKPENAIKTYKYSGDGRFFALASNTGVQVFDAESATLVSEIQLRTVIDICFSPLGSQIQTWERHIKPEDGQPAHQNLKVWEVSSGAEIIGFSQKSQDGWALQYTENESKAVRIVSNEVHVFDPKNFSAGIAEKLRLEGVTSFCVSPGSNPSLGLFVAEKKGAPAIVKIHSLATLSSQSSSKNFYKADKIVMKWNTAGSSLLFLTQTEVDKTGKSYYGETNLYMMTASGNFDCRVVLDKEGGIHDFAWSPNDKEFSVTYGYMPAKTVIFDARVNMIHDFGTQPRNFLAYNPQSRLLCIAGFGNLAGQVDIWDRRTLKKVCTIDAPNTSHCEWSPDGRYLLCATLSPRLRVDNGLRIFHFSGALMHVESIEELYQASWRPAAADKFPFPAVLEAAPTASLSVQTAAPVKAAAAGGAYRPPHARGTLTPTHFKREDEGGLAHTSSNGFSSNLSSGRTSPNFGGSRARRAIPGAAAPVDEPASSTNDATLSRRKKKEAAGKKGNGVDSPVRSGNATPIETIVVKPALSSAATAAALEAEAALSSDDKKKRALMKKLTAIEMLKAKLAGGEKLELTQHKKLESEAEIRRDLKLLG